MVTISDKISRTYAEYRFIPRKTPEGLSKDKIDLTAQITKDTADRQGIRLKLPVVSAAMQSVTGPEMAIALAQQGGLGVLFCSQTIEHEAMMVKAVKRARAGFVSMVEVVQRSAHTVTIRDIIEQTGYNVIPVVEGDRSDYGRFFGIIEGPIPPDVSDDTPAEQLMQHFNQETLEKIVEREKGSADARDLIDMINDYLPYGSSGISLDDANLIMNEHRLKYLPIVNKDNTLKFMVFKKDLQAHTDFPNSVVGPNKRYRVGASINTHDYKDRVPALVEAGVDVLFIDSSDGFTDYQDICINHIKKEFPDTPIVAGNIISGEAFDNLAALGVDGVKFGMGGGSICITQEQKGTGRGQSTAGLEISEHRDRFADKTGDHIPIISDGGLGPAKDVAMALAFGADAVMMGRYFGGCHESPPPIIEIDGKPHKEYWGEGSLRAKEWSGKRYGQNEFDEGVTSFIPYTGRVADNLNETFAKIYATMTSVGAHDIASLQKRALVELISDASRKEGGVHDVKEVGKTSTTP